MPPPGRLLLNLFLAGTGHHEASWRHPDANPAFAASAEHYIALAAAAEKASIESVFVADGLSSAVDVEHGMPRNFEPISLLGAIAARTEQIGLIGTMSTTFSEPYNAARQFASLDHISDGRAGWNIVTTAENRSARNFNLAALPSHEERYGRASEFLQVVKALWDSWEDQANVVDTESGRYADPKKIRPISHVGERFRVTGPLNISRSPQGHPVLVQAGTSTAGRNFAALHAEVIFTVHQQADDARKYYRAMKAMVAARGRDPKFVKILPGIVPIVGDTEAAARSRAEELSDLIVTARAIAALEERIGITLSDRHLDSPMPPLPSVSQYPGQQGRYREIKEMAEREQLTLRQMIRRLGGGRGHHTAIGTPEQVVDRMEHWYRSEAADGFTVLPALLPEGLDLFVGHVVPELRRRGLTHGDYEGATLREHYGLPRPT